MEDLLRTELTRQRGILATFLLAENSHQGFEPSKPTLHQGSSEVNPNRASGIQPRLRSEGVGSRCSGKERDTESGLDYFGARYFSGPQGRFTTVDPTMQSVVLENPQSWNRYSYTINNPLRYIDPTGELWIASGNPDNPYSWVDECKKNQTCHVAVAASVNGQLRIYGSLNANDTTDYAANKYGNIGLFKLSEHPDADFIVKPGAQDFLSLKNAVALFNTVEEFSETFSIGGHLFITDAGKATGVDFKPHKTHGQGRAVDLRYMDDEGNSLQGNRAAANADVKRVRTLVDIAKAHGFNQIYSSRASVFGTQYAPGHRNHLHIGTRKPVAKIVPPKK